MEIVKLFLKSFNDYLKIKEIEQPDKQIFFYAENSSDWDHLDPIANELQKNAKIIKVVSDINDKYINKPNTYYVGYGSIRTIFFKTLKAKAIVMTMTELDSSFIKKSNNNVKYFYVFHSIVSTHRVYKDKAFDNYDYILCVGDHHINEIESREKLYNLPKKKLFKHGYGKLDSLEEKLSKKINSNETNKNILIAPTWGDSSILKSCIINLTKILLDNSFSVKIRLHTMSMRYDKKIIKELKANFSKDLNFSFDDEMNSLESFYESTTMISEWSGAAIEFAFSKCRPVIYINTKPKINNKNWDNINSPCLEDTIREKIGVVIDEKDISSIPKLISTLNMKNTEWKKQIQKVKDETIFNLNNSGEYGAKIILENI